jgi:hypothetical protein
VDTKLRADSAKNHLQRTKPNIHVEQRIFGKSKTAAFGLSFCKVTDEGQVEDLVNARIQDIALIERRDIPCAGGEEGAMALFGENMEIMFAH